MQFTRHLGQKSPLKFLAAEFLKRDFTKSDLSLTAYSQIVFLHSVIIEKAERFNIKHMGIMLYTNVLASVRKSQKKKKNALESVKLLMLKSCEIWCFLWCKFLPGNVSLP